MKKWIAFLGVLLLGSSMSYGSTSTVSATVVDSDTTVWAGATWSLSFQPGSHESNPAKYTVGGVALDPAVAYQSGAANGSGVISFTAYQSTSISPADSSFNLTVCPVASSPCSSIDFAPSSGTTNLSTAINAVIIAPRFLAVSGAFGYTDIEATYQLKPGSTYWNTTNSIQRCYTGSTWGACGSTATGNVVGPGSSTADGVATYADTTGKLLKSPLATLASSGGDTYFYLYGDVPTNSMYFRPPGSCCSGGSIIVSRPSLGILVGNNFAGFSMTDTGGGNTLINGSYNYNSGLSNALGFSGIANTTNPGGDISFQPGHATGAADGLLRFKNAGGTDVITISTNAIINPGFKYSAAGTALPACASGTLGKATVSDATVATPGTAYTSGGTYTIAVQCIFNSSGSVYSWIID